MSAKNTAETLPQGRVSKIIQIHPSLHCNLFCKHCYSSSAPEMKGGLDVVSILDILAQASQLGYNVVSLSGGEPFLYRQLEDLVKESSAMGYFNSVTTNGMLLRSAFSKKVLQHLNLVAVSIDGKEDVHDSIRGLTGAFQKAMDGIKVLQEYNMRFGFIHTVQPNSWQLFPWMAELALEKGASLLHLHPLELAGRASEYFAHTSFTDEALYKTYITHYYLQTYYEPQLFIQLDLLHRNHIRDNPTFCFHANDISVCDLDTFSCLFRELIIDEKGDILPIAHGCSKYFRIGNISEAMPLAEMVERFMETRFTELMQVYRLTYEEILEDPQKEIFNWSELAIKNTHRFGAEVMVY